MRVVSKEEKKKRGCIYCRDRRKGGMCKHNECPYHELDEYETYEDFFEAQGNVLEGLFGEGAE